MKIEVQKSFEKDISKISDKTLATKLKQVIESLEAYKSITEIPNIKKLTSAGNYYRKRVGNYRLGFKLQGSKLILLRFQHRKDIYKNFP